MTSRTAAEAIWNHYERYLSPLLSDQYNGPAACDRESFLMTVTDIIEVDKGADALKTAAATMNRALDEALNSGDGVYRP